MNDREAQYAFIQAKAKQYPVTTLIKLTEVSRSGYYKWLKRKGYNDRDRKDEELFPYFQELFRISSETYGRERMKGELESEYGLIVNEKRVSRIMKKYGFQCKIRRKRFRNRKQPHGNVPNLLNQNFKAMRPGLKFAIDITYIEVLKGPQRWGYACAIKDLFNGEIVSHATGTSQDLKLVYRALEGLKKTRFEKGAILHSDQGVQFTNRGYSKRLENMGLTQSMSRRGNCWDNACIENFFGHLKCEMYCFSQPETAVEVQQAVDAYIDYYNNKRYQKKLATSPIKYRLKAA